MTRSMSKATTTTTTMTTPAQQRQQRVPADVLVEYVSPYLDRTTWNNLSLTNRELHSALNTKLPPWPKQFRSFLPIGNQLGDIFMSPNREWLVYSLGFGDDEFCVYHRRTGYLNNVIIPNEHKNAILIVKFIPNDPNKLVVTDVC